VQPATRGIGWGRQAPASQAPPGLAHPTHVQTRDADLAKSVHTDTGPSLFPLLRPRPSSLLGWPSSIRFRPLSASWGPAPRTGTTRRETTSSVVPKPSPPARLGTSDPAARALRFAPVRAALPGTSSRREVLPSLVAHQKILTSASGRL
jgi:hypothetical protein